MAFSNQANHGYRMTVEVEVDESCIVFVGVTVDAEDGLPGWVYEELQRAANGIKQKLADGWDGTESDTAEDEAGGGTSPDENGG